MSLASTTKIKRFYNGGNRNTTRLSSISRIWSNPKTGPRLVRALFGATENKTVLRFFTLVKFGAKLTTKVLLGLGWSNFRVCQTHIVFENKLWGRLAPYSQTEGSVLVPPCRQSQPEKWFERSSNEFDKLKNLTNLDVAKSSWLGYLGHRDLRH